MYQLAIRGYTVQFTDSRFPTEDLLIVSASGKHFGIDVKGQRTKDFWQFGYKRPNPELFIAYVYVPMEGVARSFIVPSGIAMRRWKKYKKDALARVLTAA